MKKVFLISNSIVIIMLMGCSSTYNLVSSDYDRSVDFTKYKTLAWLPDKADTANTPYDNQIIRNNIRNYLGQCMSGRGYSIDLENPGLLMQLIITNAKKERLVNSYQSLNPLSYYYRPYYYGSLYYLPYQYNYYYRGYQSYNYSYPNTITSRKEEYVEGAITLNFVDATTKQLVWTGTAKGDIYDASYINSNLHPAVHTIIEAYPVKSLVKRTHKIK